MAWYISRTAASMPPRSRDKGSRRWFGPFADERAARRELDALIADGRGMTDLFIEEEAPLPVATETPRL